MGKITLHRNPSSTRLSLKGKLAGPWVDEVARIWCDVVASLPAKSVTVDLAGVSFIDSEGIKLLCWLFQQGTHLRANHLMTQFIIHHVAQEAKKARNAKPSPARATVLENRRAKSSSVLELAT